MSDVPFTQEPPLGVWECGGNGFQVLMAGDWETGEYGPIDSKPCRCPACSAQKKATPAATEAA